MCCIFFLLDLCLVHSCRIFDSLLNLYDSSVRTCLEYFENFQNIPFGPCPVLFSSSFSKNFQGYESFTVIMFNDE